MEIMSGLFRGLNEESFQSREVYRNGNNSFESTLGVHKKSSFEMQESTRQNFSTIFDQSRGSSKFSFEELRVFKEVIQSNEITKTELTNMPFSYLPDFYDLAFDIGNPRMGLTMNALMDNQAKDMMQASKFTNNQNFNEALYMSMTQIEVDIKRTTLLHEVKNNITQVNKGMEISFSLSVTEVHIVNNNYSLKTSPEDFDYSQLIKNALSLTDKMLSDASIKEKERVHYTNVKETYSVLERNYNSIQSQQTYSGEIYSSSSFIYQEYRKVEISFEIEQKQEKFGNIIASFYKYNLFEGLSEEEKENIIKIFKDDNITTKELEDIPIEDAKKAFDLLLNKLPKESKKDELGESYIYTLDLSVHSILMKSTDNPSIGSADNYFDKEVFEDVLEHEKMKGFSFQQFEHLGPCIFVR